MDNTLVDSRAVAARIKRRRLELGLHQRQIGVPGASYAYISRIESGQRTPSIGALVKIAAKLDVSPLWLLTGEDNHQRCPLCGGGKPKGDSAHGRNGNGSTRRRR